MSRLSSVKLYAAASVLLPAAAVLIWRSELWLLAVFVAWSILAAIVWISVERKEQEQRHARTTHALQSASVRTLNHHRHDWMNDLQVLYGYIRMGKTDRTVQYVEQIRDRMTEESKIARLGVPSLIAFIQSFRTLTHSLQLDVRIEGELNLTELPIDSDRVSEAIMELINLYRFGIKPSGGEPAKITLEIGREEKALLVTFRLSGELNDPAQWQQGWKQRVKGSGLAPAGSDQSPACLQLLAKLAH
ncbi:Spo0B domain-containing protein [Paenibacillus aurantiacus]|uniref:Spo0B domain-containing protein n=1 Tax=Paenibacillus aurantiacus TaxID=1936118 RepID=A0ABV5KPT6_9BACL